MWSLFPSRQGSVAVIRMSTVTKYLSAKVQQWPAIATHLVSLESGDNLVALAERLLLLLFTVELVILQEVENASRGRSRLGRIG